MSAKNTIFALATPYGKSGVAVVRLSGPDALGALMALTGQSVFEPNYARYVRLRSTDGETIDHGLAIYFKAPHSFTGEDVAELQVHGSVGVIRQLLAVLARMDGLRPAESGEFTRRAFISGKMDLLEAEGLADLIDAETTHQKKQALRQMSGGMSRYFGQIRDDIIHVLALMEAYIDFPDEEIPHSVIVEVNEHIGAMKHTISSALDDDHRGQRLRDGIHAVILGAPNVGKSSLLNMLAKRDAAIVSHRAGTTRDVIEVHLDIAGFPVVLTDTAGLRETSDDIEQEGIERAKRRAEAADVRMLVFDAGQLGELDRETYGLIDSNGLIIINKSDILTEIPAISGLPVKPIYISAKNGAGAGELIEALESRLAKAFDGAGQAVITQERHRVLMLEALECLSRFDVKLPLELACEELRLAAQAISKITGKIQVDELLDVVFKRFCIGK